MIEYKNILQHINTHITLTPAEEKIFTDLLTNKIVKKKQYLLQQGQVCDKSFFVTNGCLKSYSIDDNGFEHILQFAPANWWITDMFSLLSGKRALLYIDAVEDTELIILTKENQLKLYDKIPKFERYFRILVENSLVSSRSRVMENLELAARERYLNFCSVYPSLINTLPQKLIAAYIGVKPEFFSKMRSEVLKKQ